jgi:hypothetical protein
LMDLSSIAALTCNLVHHYLQLVSEYRLEMLRCGVA